MQRLHQRIMMMAARKVMVMSLPACSIWGDGMLLYKMNPDKNSGYNHISLSVRNIMYIREMLRFPLRLAYLSPSGARSIRSLASAHSPVPQFAGRRVDPHQLKFLAKFSQNVRSFSSELSAAPQILIVSANCARRIQHLQKQKTSAGSGKSAPVLHR